MAWDRNKWNKFVADNIKTPPTNAAYQQAVDDASALATNHEEDIDITALGVARVKKMLEELAASTPGPTGPKGPDGTLNPNAVGGLTTNQKYNYINTNAPGGTTTKTISNIFTFDANDLDGTKDILVIRCSTYNVGKIKLLWTPRNVPGNPGLATTNLWPASVLPGTINGSGAFEFYMIESADLGNSLKRSAVSSIAIGNIKIGNYAYNTIEWADTSGVENWMSVGGSISVQIISTTAATFGIMI
jgi:hypothetical protein